ncbi:MAG TPA: DHA2 family efflux MFS transporter permease subunit [Candidatus Acidoferrales bacterium]|nr:DHA2 family efflux MFS transporter permease subunit [Candidatus Acidoferrales bacterium]
MNTAAKGTNPWAVLAVFALGTFLTLLDLTIVNIAIPSIVDDIHAPLDGILWMLNAYSLVYAVLLITSGRLGDIYGPRQLFGMGVIVFTISSALSGLSQDATQLVLSRAGQGLGAALLAPQGLPMITSIFPPDRRGGVFAIFGMLAGLAVVLGPTLGGLIVSNWGWRWIFYVNVPVGALIVVLTWRVIPDLRPGRPHRLDFSGVALASLGLFGIIFGLIEGQRYDWGTITGFITIPEVIGAGVLLIGLFLWQQTRRQGYEPLLPFEVFADRNFALMAFVLMAMGFAIVGVFLPLTIYFQSVLGLDAFQAGLTIAPQPVAMMLASGPVAALISRGYGKRILFVGLVLFVVGQSIVAYTVAADADRWATLPGLILAGLGMAGVWTPLYDLATRTLQPRLAGAASGVLSTIQELGAVLATAAIGAVLQNQLATALHNEATTYAAQLPAPVRTPFIDGFAGAAKSGFEVGAGQSGAALQLPPGVPAEVAVQITQIAHTVFTHAFVDAMKPAMALALAVVFVAALVSLGARQPKSGEIREAVPAVA